jgi:hypothetical protein
MEQAGQCAADLACTVLSCGVGVVGKNEEERCAIK